MRQRRSRRETNEEMLTGIRRCTACGVSKPFDEFHKNPKSLTGRQSMCKLCFNAYGKEYNKLKYKGIGKLIYLVKRYRLTAADIERLNLGGVNKCAICDQEATKIDHHHITGRVRGMLCNRCNIMIAFLDEDLTFIERATAYVNSFK